MIEFTTWSENTKCMFLSRVAQEQKMEEGEEQQKGYSTYCPC